MKQDTFHLALKATARVALCAGLVGIAGCGSKKESPRMDVEAPLPKQVIPEKSKTKIPRTIQRPEKCIAHTREVFSREQPNPTEQTKVCCQEIAEYQDASRGLEQAWKLRNECCELLNWQGSLACTPWGPPVPQRMPS